MDGRGLQVGIHFGFDANQLTGAGQVVNAGA
jgi:hypothetical protein